MQRGVRNLTGAATRATGSYKKSKTGISFMKCNDTSEHTTSSTEHDN